MHDDLFDNDTLRQAYLMGFDPGQSFYDLNLAGAQGLPNLNDVTGTVPAASPHGPTFTLPDTSVPKLPPYDLSEPGIDLLSTTDPALSDLSARPYGLDILQASAAHYNPTPEDPLLPDLRHPDLTPQTKMAYRPGDLAKNALQQMHLDLTYQEIGDKEYPEVFFDQAGNNTTRARHMDLLMYGLDEEEQ